jgi:hypothetical protein
MKYFSYSAAPTAFSYALYVTPRTAICRDIPPPCSSVPPESPAIPLIPPIPPENESLVEAIFHQSPRSISPEIFIASPMLFTTAFRGFPPARKRDVVNNSAAAKKDSPLGRNSGLPKKAFAHRPVTNRENKRLTFK